MGSAIRRCEVTQQQKQPHDYVAFTAARRFLEAAGMKVERTKYDYRQYFVSEGDRTLICQRWDVIEIAQQRGMKHE